MIVLRKAIASRLQQSKDMFPVGHMRNWGKKLQNMLLKKRIPFVRVIAYIKEIISEKSHSWRFSEIHKENTPHKEKIQYLKYAITRNLQWRVNYLCQFYPLPLSFLLQMCWNPKGWVQVIKEKNTKHIPPPIAIMLAKHSLDLHLNLIRSVFVLGCILLVEQ